MFATKTWKCLGTSLALACLFSQPAAVLAATPKVNANAAGLQLKKHVKKVVKKPVVAPRLQPPVSSSPVLQSIQKKGTLRVQSPARLPKIGNKLAPRGGIALPKIGPIEPLPTSPVAEKIRNAQKLRFKAPAELPIIGNKLPQTEGFKPAKLQPGRINLSKVAPNKAALAQKIQAAGGVGSQTSARKLASSPAKLRNKLEGRLRKEPELDSPQPQSPTGSVAVNRPVSPGQLEKLLGDPIAELDKKVPGADENLLLFDVGAKLADRGRGSLNVFTSVAQSVSDSTYTVGERGQADTRYGSKGSLIGETMTAGTTLAPVQYVEGEGVRDASKGETQKRYGDTVLGDIGRGLAHDNQTTLGQAMQQALDEQDSLGGNSSSSSSSNSTGSSSGSTDGSSNDAGSSSSGSSTDSSGASTSGSSTQGSTGSKDAGQSDSNANPVVKHHASDDQSQHFFEYADGTTKMVDLDTGTEITVKPDGTVTEKDANGNTTTYKPSTPASDTPPLDPWVQQQIDQSLAELRAAGYQPGGEDIDWGDWNTGTGYLLSDGGGKVPDLKEKLLGATPVRPKEVDQEGFQQPDDGHTDPNPNDGN